MAVKITELGRGKLAVPVHGQGHRIPSGVAVIVERVEDFSKGVSIMVTQRIGNKQVSVNLPYMGTDVDDLLGQ